MSYNSESLEVTVVISGNGVLSKDIKISLGLLITVRKMHVLHLLLFITRKYAFICVN